MKKNNKKCFKSRVVAGIISFFIAVSSICIGEYIARKEENIFTNENYDLDELEKMLQQLNEAYLKKYKLLKQKEPILLSMLHSLDEKYELLEEKEIEYLHVADDKKMCVAYMRRESPKITTVLERENIDKPDFESLEETKNWIQLLRQFDLKEEESQALDNIEFEVNSYEKKYLDATESIFEINNLLDDKEITIQELDNEMQLLELQLQQQLKQEDDRIDQIEKNLRYLGFGELNDILSIDTLSEKEFRGFELILENISDINREIGYIEYFERNFEREQEDVQELEKVLIHFEDTLKCKSFDLDELYVIEASVGNDFEKNLYIVEGMDTYQDLTDFIYYDDFYKPVGSNEYRGDFQYRFYDYIKHEHDASCVNYVHVYSHSIKPLSEFLTSEEKEFFYIETPWNHVEVRYQNVTVSDLDTILERLRSEYEVYKEEEIASKTFDIYDLYVVEASVDGFTNDLYIVDNISHFDVEYRDRFTARGYSDLNSHEHSFECLNYVHYDFNNRKLLLDYLTLDEFKTISENENKITGAQLDEILKRIQDEYSQEKSWFKKFLIDGI